uniref:Uncharacterized protein n=1 Tax=Alexandrium monilatum TaxID=311494 RepID=A0A7S4W7Q5_9DINO
MLRPPDPVGGGSDTLAVVRGHWSTVAGRCRLLAIPGFVIGVFIEAPRALERPVFGVGGLVFVIVGAGCCATWLNSDSDALAEVMLHVMQFAATMATHADILTDPDLARNPWSVIIFLSIAALHFLVSEIVGAEYARRFLLGEITVALLSTAWIAKEYGLGIFSSWGMTDSLATNLSALLAIALFFGAEDVGFKTFVVGRASNRVERAPEAGRDFLPVVPGIAQEGVQGGPGPDAAARAQDVAEVRRGGREEGVEGGPGPVRRAGQEEGVGDGLGSDAAARARGAADVRGAGEETGLGSVLFGRPLAAAAA